MKRKHWIRLGAFVFCPLLIYLWSYSFGLVLVYFAIAGYCFAAYHARGLEIDRQAAKEAERFQQAHRAAAHEHASRNIEDRRRRG